MYRFVGYIVHPKKNQIFLKLIKMIFRNFKIKGAEFRSQQSLLKITNTEVPTQNDYLPFFPQVYNFFFTNKNKAVR
jgi:desulfoferrodoxin (superoxide reductase-like protein)